MFLTDMFRDEGEQLRVGVEPSMGVMKEVGLAGWEWVPLGCLVIYMFVMCLGIRTVPYILAAEYFPTTIRPQVSTINILWLHKRLFHCVK